MTTDSPQMALLKRHTHALIDWASVVYERWHDELPVHPLVPHYFRSDANRMPVLLTLDSVSDAHMRLLCANLEDAENRPFMQMLACLLRVGEETSHDSLVFHLTSMLMLDGPGRDGARRLLKYCQGGVFLHLLRILPPRRIRQLFGPVQTWSVPFQREWITFTPPETTDLIPTYWAVDEKQQQRIGRIGHINTVLIRWRDQTNRRWASIDDFHADAEKVDQILIFAEHRYQLRDLEDRLAFAEHSMTYGEHFHEHPRIQQIMQAVQEKGWGYAEKSLVITEDDWKAIEAAQGRPKTR